MQIPPICHTTRIRSTPQVVFKTLTTPEGWDAWFTHGTTITPGVGGQIRLRWQQPGSDRPAIEDGGTIHEWVPNQAFTFDWGRGENPTRVAFEITACALGTRVTVTETGHTQAPKDMIALVSCACGWGEAVTLLKMYLEHRIQCKNDLVY